MSEAKAQPAALKAVIQIKRKDTGKVEEYTITGTAQPKPAEKKD